MSGILFGTPGTQSPKAYDLNNLQGAQLASRIAAAASAAVRGNVRTALQDGAYLYLIHPDETAAGLADTNLTFGFPVGNVLRYKAVGDNATDDTVAFNRAFAANKGKTVHIPYAPGAGHKYLIPAGITVASHSWTKVTCDPNAQINVTNAADIFLQMQNCVSCDFDFPQVFTVGTGAAVLMTSTNAQTGYNRIGFHQLTGPGKAGAKPATPVSGSIGIYIQGPALGDSNYYNYIKPGTYIYGFDCSVAMHTPAAGSMNANANYGVGVHMEQFWYGFYTNSVENRFVDAQWYNSEGLNGSNAELVRLGDGTYATNFNYVTGTSETGGTYVSTGSALANSTGNYVEIINNEAFGFTDSGSQNTVLVHGTYQWGKPATFLQGVNIQPSAAADALAVTATNAAGQYGVHVDASAANAVGLKIVGHAAGTPTVVLNSTGTTGAQTPTLGSNKPGVANGTPGTWIPVIVDGTTFYIPAWS